MAGTLNDYIVDYIGAYSDTEALGRWLTKGAHFFIIRLPSEILLPFSKNVDVNSAGKELTPYRLLQVLANGYDVREEKYGRKAQLQDKTSIYYATATSPASIIETNKIYIYPSGGKIVVIEYPTLTTTSDGISVLPQDLEQAVVIYACIHAIISKFATLISEIGALSWTDIVAPTAPTAPSITYTDADSAWTETIVIGSLGTPPTYTPPSFGGSFTALNNWINTEEDSEIASAEVAQQRVYLEKFQTDMQNAVNSFNEELAEYRASVEKVLAQNQLNANRVIQKSASETELAKQNALSQMQADIADYDAQLKLFAEKINEYQVQVNREVTHMNTMVGNKTAQTNSWVVTLKTLKDEFNLYLSNYGMKA